MLRGFAGVLFLFTLCLTPAWSEPKTRSGAELFKVYCLKCHTTSRNYSIGPNLWHVMHSGRMTEQQFREVVMKGRNTMPAFERRLTGKELDRLVAYLKTK